MSKKKHQKPKPKPQQSKKKIVPTLYWAEPYEVEEIALEHFGSIYYRQDKET